MMSRRVARLLLARRAIVTRAALRNSETFSKHVVVAGEGHAADVGREILARGGNAIDAAIATAFALAVTLARGGKPGRRRLHRRLPGDRREVVTVDFREMAPRTATPTMYLGPDGKPRPRYRAGAWAAGVPGTVRGLGLAHARFGKTAWAELVRPAARLAREGFPISAELARSLNRQLAPREPGTRPTSRTRRLRPAGRFPRVDRRVRQARPHPWKAGDRLIQRDLAACLDRIADRGRRRILHRPDRPAHRPIHERKGGLRHPRRPEGYRSQAAAAGPHDVSRLRRL